MFIYPRPCLLDFLEYIVKIWSFFFGSIYIEPGVLVEYLLHQGAQGGYLFEVVWAEISYTDEFDHIVNNNKVCFFLII